MSESDPTILFPRAHAADGNRDAAAGSTFGKHTQSAQTTFFNRRELSEILAVYGRKVASGEWRDYAIDGGRDKAVFSVFRRASEVPLYRIEKHPKLARRQGAYQVVAATGLILKRGNDLHRVLGVLENGVRLVAV